MITGHRRTWLKKSDPPYAVPLRQFLLGNRRPLLLVLAAATALLVLLSCTAVSNLLFALTLDRRREWAVRSALGASPRSLQALIAGETVLLAVPGTIGALLLAAWARQLSEWFRPPALPADPHRGAGSLLLAVALAAAFATFAAILPALRASKEEPGRALNSVDSAGPANLRGARRRALLGTRETLLAIQLTLAMILVTGAALLTRSLRDLVNAPLGIETRNTLMLDTYLPAPGVIPAATTSTLGKSLSGSVPTSTQRAQSGSPLAVYDRIQRRLGALPGVVSVGLITPPPFEQSMYSECGVSTEGGQGRQTFLAARCSLVGAGTLQSLGVFLTSGRYFEGGDQAGSPLVGIVSRSLARAFWPGENPIGRFVNLGPESQPRMAAVVGVVADVRRPGLAAGSFVPQQLYLPLPQTDNAVQAVTFTLRTSAAPPAAASLQSALHSVAPRVAISRIVGLDHVVAGMMAGERYAAALFAAFSLLAIFAAVATAGALAYQDAAWRRREFAIRMSLGARQGHIGRLVL
ncbi:MAG: FtsX-like permease family protein [Terriglobales bacterium]